MGPKVRYGSGSTSDSERLNVERFDINETISTRSLQSFSSVHPETSLSNTHRHRCPIREMSFPQEQHTEICHAEETLVTPQQKPHCTLLGSKSVECL